MAINLRKNKRGWRYGIVLAFLVAERLIAPASADSTPRAGSQPVHEVKIEFDRRIPMRDGVTPRLTFTVPRPRDAFPSF